jgi:hypothetical protein
VRLVFRSADQKWHDDTSALPQPTITLTHPTAGGSVTQGAAVALSATATAGEGTVEKVEFFVNGTKVGEDLRIAHPGPWSANWTPSTIGVAEIRAVVTNTAGRTLSTGIVTVTVAASGVTNTPPTITALSDVTVTSGASTPVIPFTVADAQTAATALTVTGASSNTALVPLANMVFAGTGANRTVVVTPVNGLTGSSIITVTVSDGTATVARSFVLTVTAAPDTTAPARPAAPTVTNAGTARPTFSGTSEPGATMSLYANGSLIGSATVGSSGTWTWTPGSDLPVGTHQITVTATDTAGNASSASPATTITVAGGATGGPGPGATGSDSGSKGGSCGVGSASAWIFGVLMLMAMSLGVRCRRGD